MKTGGNSLGFNNGLVKQSFFAACNCIYANAKQLDELMHLTLQNSYCLPILIPMLLLLKNTRLSRKTNLMPVGIPFIESYLDSISGNQLNVPFAG